MGINRPSLYAAFGNKKGKSGVGSSFRARMMNRHRISRHDFTDTIPTPHFPWIPMRGLRLNKMAPEPPRSPLKSQGSDAKGCI